MNQTKLGSMIEACVNTAIGLVVAFISQLVIFPAVGIYVPLATNIEISIYFTVVSVARSYVLRRWFNARLHAAAMKAASLVSAEATT